MDSLNALTFLLQTTASHADGTDRDEDVREGEPFLTAERGMSADGPRPSSSCEK